jgi:dihydrofolate reductase
MGQIERDNMTMKCSVYCGASLDGFIAGPGGDIEWLHRPEYSHTEQAGLTYDAFITTVDTIVMGRNTFDIALSFDRWPYQLPVIVLSSRSVDVPDHLRGKVRIKSAHPRDLVAELAAEGARHLYVDGGITIQRFLQARLIHEITVTYLPILLGAGIPLFGSTGVETPLKLIEVTAFQNGFVQVRYSVQNAVQPALPQDGPLLAGESG